MEKNFGKSLIIKAKFMASAKFGRYHNIEYAAQF